MLLMLLLELRTTRPTIPMLPRTRTRSLSLLFFFCRFFISIPHYPLEDTQLRLNDPGESLNNVHLWTHLLAAWNHVSLVLRLDLLILIVTPWHSTNIIVHRNTHVTHAVNGGWRRRPHASGHYGSFWLRHLPPTTGRKWSVIVLVGRRRKVIGWILISIDALTGIVIDGRWWDGGIVSLHMHFRWLQVRWR